MLAFERTLIQHLVSYRTPRPDLLQHRLKPFLGGRNKCLFFCWYRVIVYTECICFIVCVRTAFIIIHHHRHFICPIIQRYAHLHRYNFRRAGQQGPTRTLTAALKRVIKQLLGKLTYSITQVKYYKRAKTSEISLFNAVPKTFRCKINDNNNKERNKVCPYSCYRAISPSWPFSVPKT